MKGITPLSTAELLPLIPQREPFRFVDRILELDDLQILGTYQFRSAESFYRGHFPGNPVTPGVILLESMCQVGVVAHGIYLMSLEYPREELTSWTTLFSDAQVEFFRPVRPGEQVLIRGEKIFWRKKKLRSRLEMTGADGAPVAVATASGIGVKNDIP